LPRAAAARLSEACFPANIRMMDWLLYVLLGIGLAAACGFRVFVPLLVISIAALTGHLELASGFGWLGTWPAVVVFAVATALEIAAYYIPWLDNLLDTVATPAAIVAGVIVTASVITKMSPVLRWPLAIIAGGGFAGAVQAATVAIRGASTATTGGLANPVASTAELGGATVLSVLSVTWPAVAGVVAVLLVAFLAWLVFRIRRRRKHRAAGRTGSSTKEER
jgi:hypothetical protein